jgi:hypothetical protein
MAEHSPATSTTTSPPAGLDAAPPPAARYGRPHEDARRHLTSAEEPASVPSCGAKDVGTAWAGACGHARRCSRQLRQQTRSQRRNTAWGQPPRWRIPARTERGNVMSDRPGSREPGPASDLPARALGPLAAAAPHADSTGTQEGSRQVNGHRNHHADRLMITLAAALGAGIASAGTAPGHHRPTSQSSTAHPRSSS